MFILFFLTVCIVLMLAVTHHLFNCGGQELQLRSKLYFKRVFFFPHLAAELPSICIDFFGSRQPLIDQVEIKCRHHVAQILPSFKGSQNT